MKRDPLIEILKSEFAQKKARNRSYSLRSFSRDLGIDPSNFSKLLNGQKILGPRLRRSLATRLGFDLDEVDGWLSGNSSRKNDRTADNEYADHSLEVFHIIAGAQHYPILELFKVKNFVPGPKSIAQKLGRPVREVQESLERLKKAGLLILNQETQRLEPADESSSSILTVATSKAHRDQQRQILEGAIDALQNTPIEFRSQSSMTMAIDSRKLPQAKELIKVFRRKLSRLLSESENLDEVYQLSISLYPVSKTKSGNNTAV